MDREEFLELFKECIKEGLISFEVHKAVAYYDYNRVEVKVEGEIIKEIGF